MDPLLTIAQENPSLYVLTALIFLLYVSYRVIKFLLSTTETQNLSMDAGSRRISELQDHVARLIDELNGYKIRIAALESQYERLQRESAIYFSKATLYENLLERHIEIRDALLQTNAQNRQLSKYLVQAREDYKSLRKSIRIDKA